MNQNLEKICFLIGNPVTHSFSPGMHRLAFKKYKMKDWDYKLKKIENEKELDKFVRKVRNKKSTGFNVTIPYKIKIMDYMDRVKKTAREIGAVNTVNNVSGKLIGYNTDHTGFRNDLQESLDFSPQLVREDRAMVLGAGGAGRVVIWVLLSIFKKVFIYDIYYKKAKKLKKEYTKIFPHRKIEVLKKDSLKEALEQISMLVNASPVGMRKGSPPLNLKPGGVKPDLKVYDVVYNRTTELIAQARSLGLRASGGIGMLSGQGAEAFRIWTGQKSPKKIMTEYLQNEVKKND